MHPTYLNKVELILIRPSHPGNIGASARAMKTMGLERLGLVAPDYFPSPTATAMASKATDILAAATVYSNLHEAIAESQLIFGTSAATDRLFDWPNLSLHTAAKLAVEQAASGQKIAFLFGTERTGMTNDELKRCHYHVHIPTGSSFSSLNLSQAVQVACYELFMACSANIKPELSMATKAPYEEQERFYEHLQKVATEVEFLKNPHGEIIMLKLRRLFQRAQLETNEIKILRGILSNIERSLKSNSE